MRKRTGIPCDVCGEPTWTPQSSGQESARHRTCVPPAEHGSRRRYESGCRCSPCREWQLNDGRRQNARRRELDENRPRCIEEGCDRPERTRGRCRTHYSRWARAHGMYQAPSDQWSDVRRSNYHARRARLRGARNSDAVLLADVIDRDGNTCAWCGTEVDLTVAWPDRMSKSLDHVIPLAKGGEHALSNAALLHLGCNSAKGTRTLEHTHGEGPLEVSQ